MWLRDRPVVGTREAGQKVSINRSETNDLGLKRQQAIKHAKNTFREEVGSVDVGKWSCVIRSICRYLSLLHLRNKNCIVLWHAGIIS